MKKTSWWVGLGLLALMGAVGAGAAAADTCPGAAVLEEPPALLESRAATLGDKWEEGIAYHKGSKDGCSGCAQLTKEWPVIVDGCGTTQCDRAKESAVKQFKEDCRSKGLSKCDCDTCILARSLCNHGPGCTGNDAK